MAADAPRRPTILIDTEEHRVVAQTIGVVADGGRVLALPPLETQDAPVPSIVTTSGSLSAVPLFVTVNVRTMSAPGASLTPKLRPDTLALSSAPPGGCTESSSHAVSKVSVSSPNEAAREQRRAMEWMLVIEITLVVSGSDWKITRAVRGRRRKRSRSVIHPKCPRVYDGPSEPQEVRDRSPHLHGHTGKSISRYLGSGQHSSSTTTSRRCRNTSTT